MRFAVIPLLGGVAGKARRGGCSEGCPMRLVLSILLILCVGCGGIAVAKPPHDVAIVCIDIVETSGSKRSVHRITDAAKIRELNALIANAKIVPMIYKVQTNGALELYRSPDKVRRLGFHSGGRDRFYLSEWDDKNNRKKWWEVRMSLQDFRARFCNPENLVIITEMAPD